MTCWLLHHKVVSLELKFTGNTDMHTDVHTYRPVYSPVIYNQGVY